MDKSEKPSGTEHAQKEKGQKRTYSFSPSEQDRLKGLVKKDSYSLDSQKPEDNV